MWLTIAILAPVLFMYVLLWSLCRIAADSDRRLQGREDEPLPPRPPGGDALAWKVRNLKVELGIASAEAFQPDDRDRLRRKRWKQRKQDQAFGETP